MFEPRIWKKSNGSSNFYEWMYDIDNKVIIRSNKVKINLNFVMRRNNVNLITVSFHTLLKEYTLSDNCVFWTSRNTFISLRCFNFVGWRLSNTCKVMRRITMTKILKYGLWHRIVDLLIWMLHRMLRMINVIPQNGVIQNW